MPENKDLTATGAGAVSSPSTSLISREEYLAMERQAETKSEYLDGRVYPMTGGTREHNLIITNLIASLHAQLRERSCEVFPGFMRVRVPVTGLYTYPDIAVVGGAAELEDEHFDTLLNPTVLIEVLSPSTERYDRGRKAEHYRRLESLEEYVFVAEDEPRIERYRRHGEYEWILAEVAGLDENLELASIECILDLREVYRRVF